jgi:hypothetical protein
MIMDPVTLLVGAAILLIGVVLGFVLGTFRRVLSPSEQVPKAICSCKHGLGQHDEKQGTCHGQVKRKDMHDAVGNYIGDQWVTCTCRHYDGPQPIEQYLAMPTLPPRDGS